MTQLAPSSKSLKDEVVSFYKQCESRYGRLLTQKIYRDETDAVVTIASGLSRSKITGDDLFAVRTWLLMGLKPFVEYPPTQENLVQMANLLKAYPMTDDTPQIRDAWYRLDTDYVYRYGRMWRGDTSFDGLVRERVWLTNFNKHQAAAGEILAAMERLDESGLFRLFCPSMDQFIDAVYAMRKGVPLVEEAWIIATNGRALDEQSPLVRTAAGMSGISNRMTSGSDKDAEMRFKSLYRNLLHDVTMEKCEMANASTETSVGDYATLEEVLEALGG